MRLIDKPLPAVIGVFLTAADELLGWVVDDDHVVGDRADVIVVPVRRFVCVVGARVDRQIALVIDREAVRVAMAVVVQIERRALEGGDGAPVSFTDEVAAGDEDESEASKALLGKPAPSFKLKDLDGKDVALSELKGSVVVLDFWATWCGPCVMSLPKIDELNKDKKGDGLKVFAVNQSEDKELVQGFIKSKGLTLPVLLDSDGKVGNKYKADAIPETVVIGKDGTVRKVFVGAGPNTEKSLREAVETAMKASK